jgi:hypothetical protein
MLKIFPSALAVIAFLLCPANAVPDPEDFRKAWRNMSGLLINEGWKGRAPEAQRKNWQVLSAKVFADYSKQYLKMTSADPAYLEAMGVDYGMQKDFFLTLGNFIVFFEGCFDWAKTQRCGQENSIPLVNTFIQNIMPVVQPTFNAHMKFYFTHFPPSVTPSQIDYIYWKGQTLCIEDTLDTRNPKKWIIFKKLEDGGFYLSALYPFGSPLSGPEGRPLYETYIPYSHGYKALEEMQPGLNDRFLVCFQSKPPQILHDSGLILRQEGHNPSFLRVYGYTGNRAFPPYAPYTTSPRIHMKCIETVEQVRQEERLHAALQEQMAKAEGGSDPHLLKGCIDNTPGLLPHPGCVIHRSVFLNPRDQHVASHSLSSLLENSSQVFIPYPQTSVDLWESLLGCLCDASSAKPSEPPPLLLLQYVQSILEATPPLDGGSCEAEEAPGAPFAVPSEPLSVEDLMSGCREQLRAAYQQKWENHIRAEQEERSRWVKEGSHYQATLPQGGSKKKKGQRVSKKHQLGDTGTLGPDLGQEAYGEKSLQERARKKAFEELEGFQAKLKAKKQTPWKFRKFSQLLGGACRILERLEVTVKHIHTSGSHTKIQGAGFSATVVVPHGGDDVVSRGNIASLGKILSFTFDQLFNQEGSRPFHSPAPPGF